MRTYRDAVQKIVEDKSEASEYLMAALDEY